MSVFKVYFLGRDVDDDPEPASYADFFLNYQSSVWQEGGGDGVFSFNSDMGDVSDLSVLESEQHGICVRYNIKKNGMRKGREFYAVGDSDALDRIEDVGDDQFAPIGSFLTPELAWLVIEDFFANPLEKSSRIQWVSSDDIKWPDDL